MAFEWAARYCSFSFLLKTDDDVFVNTRRLIDVLRLKSTPKKGLYMGKVNHNPIVQRGKGKWRVSYIEYSLPIADHTRESLGEFVLDKRALNSHRRTLWHFSRSIVVTHT